jgi:hypothetical protein
VETDLIHTFGPYDFEVDTTNTVPSAVAAAVLAAWRAGTRQRALWQGISGNRGTLSVPAATGTRRADECDGQVGALHGDSTAGPARPSC